MRPLSFLITFMAPFRDLGLPFVLPSPAIHSVTIWTPKWNRNKQKTTTKTDEMSPMRRTNARPEGLHHNGAAEPATASSLSADPRKERERKKKRPETGRGSSAEGDRKRGGSWRVNTRGGEEEEEEAEEEEGRTGWMVRGPSGNGPMLNDATVHFRNISSTEANCTLITSRTSSSSLSVSVFGRNAWRVLPLETTRASVTSPMTSLSCHFLRPGADMTSVIISGRLQHTHKKSQLRIEFSIFLYWGSNKNEYYTTESRQHRLGVQVTTW